MWNEPCKARLTRIPKLYETEGIPLKNKLIHLHFFIGDCDWYVAEYENGRFWGYVILNGDTINAEWGYFSFNDLKDIKIHSCFEIDCEAEKSWKIKKASEIKKIRI